MRAQDQIGTGSNGAGRLNSWKEIASFFDRDVRTVRRWETTRGLPVRRVPGGSRSGVFAYQAELEAWLREPGHAGIEDSDPERAAATPEILAAAEDPAAGPEPALPEFQPAHAEPGAALPPRYEETPEGSERRRWMLVSAVLIGLLIFAGAKLARRHERQEYAVAEGPSRAAAGVERGSVHPEAQELYLRGLYLFNQRTEGTLTEANGLFRRAIADDPHFAAAWAGLAESYLLLRQYGHLTDGEAYPHALAATLAALREDEDSPEAHRAYAFILNYWIWDFPAAQREFERALELKSEDAQTHSWYATSLYSVGRSAEALREIDTARRLHPDAKAILANRGLLLSAVDRDAALTYLLDLEKVSPDFASVHAYLSLVYFERGEYGLYLEQSRAAAVLRSDSAEVALLDRAKEELGARGPGAMLRSVAEGYGKLVDAGRQDALLAASLWMRAGDADRAMRYLELSCDRHESTFLAMNRDAVFQPLYTRPEWAELLQHRTTPLTQDVALKTGDAAALRCGVK